MLAECEKECYGLPQTGLMIRGNTYDINPTDPWAIHFKLPQAERLIAIKAHRERVEAARVRKNRLAELKEKGIEEDGYSTELSTGFDLVVSDATAAALGGRSLDTEKFICPVCGKEAASKLGLGSHMRSHPEAVVET